MLSPEKLKFAIAYNSMSEKAEVLRLRSGLAAGTFANAVAETQENAGLTVDGKCGPKSLDAVDALLDAWEAGPCGTEALGTVCEAPTEVASIGAWAGRSGIFDVKDSIELALKAGLAEVSLCAHAQDAGKPFTPFVSAPKLRDIVRRYRQAGIAPSLMFWPQPDVAHTEAVLAYLHEVHPGGDLASADLDAEEQWTRHPMRVKNGKAVAALYRAKWPVGLPLALNGITAALPKIQDLVDVADVVIPQAYTSNKPSQNGVPGERQQHVIQVWRKAAPKAQMVLGLAAYGQSGAGGLAAPEALERAFAVAKANGIPKVRYWALSNMSDPDVLVFVVSKSSKKCAHA